MCGLGLWSKNMGTHDTARMIVGPSGGDTYTVEGIQRTYEVSQGNCVYDAVGRQLFGTVGRGNQVRIYVFNWGSYH